MTSENKVVTAIALCAVDTGKVTEVDELANSMFTFVDREVSVKRIAQAMDGSTCFSVSAVHNGLLNPLAKLWVDASRSAGIIVLDERVPSDLSKWLLEVAEVMEEYNEQ
jgi:hypothetical protein